MIAVPGEQEEERHVPDHHQHRLEPAGHSEGSVEHYGARLASQEIIPVVAPPLHPDDKLRVQVSRGDLDYRAEANTEGEGGDRLEERPQEAHEKGVSRLIIVQEEIVQVLLRKYDLEDDGYQDEGVGDLVGRGLGRNQG